MSDPLPLRQEALLQRLREVVATTTIPLPGSGATAARHRALTALGREDLSLARLAEAHFDAVAILAEAGREPVTGAIYGVWASEIPGSPLRVETNSAGLTIWGEKHFCSGAGLIDRALVTVPEPSPTLIDLNVSSRTAAGSALEVDDSVWKVDAFAETRTARVRFSGLAANAQDVVGPSGFYLDRPGFWYGACGPASCWAGGALSLVDWAAGQRREDPHTLAHLGAMYAAGWAIEAALGRAGHEIDAQPADRAAAQRVALTARHIVERHAAEILDRLGRAFGPYPLAMDAAMAGRIAELTIYIRQCHAERDLEALGRAVRSAV